MKKQFKNRLFVRKCKRLIRASLFGLYAAIAFNTNSSIAAPTGELEDWRFSPQGSQLEISVSAPVKPQYFYLSQPPRIVVDLPDTKLGYVPTQQNYNGAIQSVRVSQLNEDITRIVLDLAPGTFFDRNQVQLQPFSWENPTRWLFRPVIANNGNYFSPGYPSVGGQLPPGATGQLPPGAYNPQLPSDYPYTPQPPGAFPQQQPPGMLPPQQPSNTLPPLEPSITLPPGQIYNPSQLPPGTDIPQSSFSAPLPLTPMENRNIGQPSVTVPPVNRSNLSPLSPQIPNSVLPPAKFPSPSGNLNPSPSLFSVPPSNLPITNTQTNSLDSSGSGVIEFGEPFPVPRR
ncbi:MAG: AMIN domain-containing protein [Cyanobacteriota bacterium]|nr:AMIN domain-containing protein [Cyanobacteriota bacterium]